MALTGARKEVRTAVSEGTLFDIKSEANVFHTAEPVFRCMYRKLFRKCI